MGVPPSLCTSLRTALSELPQDPVLHWYGYRANTTDTSANYAVHSPELAVTDQPWSWMLVGNASHSSYEVWAKEDPRPSRVLLVEPDFDLWVISEASTDQNCSDPLGASVTSIATWSSDLVSATLSMWVRTVVGRDDVHFTMESANPTTVLERVYPLGAGTPRDNMYRISDSLGVDERVFSELLALPHDQAALLTREIGYLTSENGYGALHWSD